MDMRHLLDSVGDLLASTLECLRKVSVSATPANAQRKRDIQSATSLVEAIAATSTFAGLRSLRQATPPAIAVLGAAIFGATANAQPLSPMDFEMLGSVQDYFGGSHYVIDTDRITFSGAGIEAPGHSVTGSLRGSVAVFCFSDIYIASASTISIIGHRPLALLSRYSINIRTPIDVGARNPTWSAHGLVAVAGGGVGGLGGSGSLGGSPGGGIGSGAGGTSDGLLPSGGSYGGGIVLNHQNAGGPVYGNPLLQLEGGSGGGGAWTNSSVPTIDDAGGSGGGAIEVGAMDFLFLPFSIFAQGGKSSRGGGGSGGAVLLHAQSVNCWGIYANGGTSDAGFDGAGGRVVIQAPYPYGASADVDPGGPGALPGTFEYAIPSIPASQSVDFGPVPVGATKAMILTLGNTGADNSYVSGSFTFPMNSDPQFTLAGKTVFSGIHPGSPASIECRFSPTATGEFSTVVYAGTDAGWGAIHVHGTGGTGCGSSDFNGDGDFGTDQDIEAFFRVLAGGHC